LHNASVPGRPVRVIAKSATDGDLAGRLQRRRWELGLSTHKVADEASEHGFVQCTAKKVSQIENGKRGIRSRAELVALAHALKTTAHELTTGLKDQDGEPVILIGDTATAHLKLTEDEKREFLNRLGIAEAHPGSPG